MTLTDDFQGIKIFYSNDLEGCGQNVSHEFLHIIRELTKFKKIESCLEWCSGPGFFGFTLLGAEICEKLDLCDIHPPVQQFVEHTIQYNNLFNKSRFYLSDNFKNIPEGNKYDLIIGNPPWFNNDPFLYYFDNPRKYKDEEWQIHEDFFANVGKYLKDGGYIVLAESVWGSSPKTFEKMAEKNNLKVTGYSRSKKYPEGIWYMRVEKKITLRDAIKDLHNKAEQSKFAHLLLSGNITEEQYSNLLYNMVLIYNCIETLCDNYGLLDGLQGVKRAELIFKDLFELSQEQKTALPITNNYIDYLINISKINPRLLLAHVYVRHFGDLYGGQIIKSKVPGSGAMYNFENRQELITKLRAILTDDLGDEARVAMQYAIDLFEALADEHNIQ